MHVGCVNYVLGELRLQEKRQKRAAELKSLGHPSTTGEAVEQMLDKKV